MDVAAYLAMTPEDREAYGRESDRRESARQLGMMAAMEVAIHDHKNPHHISIKSDHVANCRCGWTGPAMNVTAHLEKVSQQKRSTQTTDGTAVAT